MEDGSPLRAYNHTTYTIQRMLIIQVSEQIQNYSLLISHMPSVTDLKTAIIQQETTRNLDIFTDLATLVLIHYDTILTLPSEIQLVWKSKIRPASVLYIIARYSFILLTIFSVTLDFLSVSVEVCDITQHTFTALQTVNGLSVYGILLARVYAITRDQKWFLVPISLIYLARVCCTVLFAVYDDCTTTTTSGPIFKLGTASAALLMTFDTLILCTILFHTIATIRLQRGIKELRKRSITYLFVQQGVFRWAVIFLWNVEGIIVNKFASTTYKGFGVNLENCISVLLVCRFFLDLRELNSQPITTNTANNLTVTTFRGALHSIGSALIEDMDDGNDPADFISGVHVEPDLPLHSAAGDSTEESAGPSRRVAGLVAQ